VTVRVGVIGTGFGAQVVAPAYATVDDCEVGDVVSPRDEAAVARLCARADIDLVSVHSPPFLHLTHVRQAIDAGHAVLCDKPFGLDADDSAEMVQLAAAAGVVGLLNFERRYDPTRERLRGLLAEGVIGPPDHFQYSRYIAVPEPRLYNWLSDRSRGGGWLGGQVSHLIDATRWLFGEITDAYAVMRTLVPERPDRDGVMHPCDAEDAVVAVMTTESGVTVAVDTAFESSVHLPERTAVHGQTGMLEIVGTRVVHTTVDGVAETHDVDLGGRPNLVVAMERWAAVVCDAVRSGTIPSGSPTFADGLACAEVMDRIRRGNAG
jgi:predicted dehydrogenase